MHSKIKKYLFFLIFKIDYNKILHNICYMFSLKNKTRKSDLWKNYFQKILSGYFDGVYNIKWFKNYMYFKNILKIL